MYFLIITLLKIQFSFLFFLILIKYYIIVLHKYLQLLLRTYITLIFISAIRADITLNIYNYY